MLSSQSNNVLVELCKGLEMKKSEISIVVGTYNRKKMLVNCIKSIRENRIEVPYEIIVVDGGSDDGTVQWLTKQDDIITIIQHNRYEKNGKMVMKKSWGYFMNLGFKVAESNFICMLSDDCYVHKDSIINGYKLFENDKEGKIGACAFPFRDSFSEDNFKVFKVFGKKILINHGIYRKDILNSIGWIDEVNYRFYKADSDLSLKIWEKGYSIVVSKNSLVEHLHHDLDYMRLVNQVESERSNDSKYFNQYWSEKFELPDSQPIIEKEVMTFDVPNKIVKYHPKDITLLVQMVERYLKNNIQRESALFRFLKRIKWISFKNNT